MIHTHSRGEAEELEKEVWMEKRETKINPDIFGYLGFDRFFLFMKYGFICGLKKYDDHHRKKLFRAILLKGNILV